MPHWPTFVKAIFHTQKYEWNSSLLIGTTPKFEIHSLGFAADFNVVGCEFNRGYDDVTRAGVIGRVTVGHPDELVVGGADIFL
jgi:hypothetical protein